MPGMRYQPQGLLRINQSSSLAAGLKLAILPGVNEVYDAAAQRAVTPTGIKPTPTQSGVAGGFGASVGIGTTDKIVTGLAGAFPATGRSYFFRALRNGTGGGGLGRLFDKTNGLTGQYFYVSAASGLTYTEYWNSAERGISCPLPAAGVWFDVLVTSTVQAGSRSTALYLNGTLVAAEAIGNLGTFNDAATTALTIGNRASDNARNWDGLIECAYEWDRILTADEVTALSANHYQLFAAPDEDFELPVVAGSVSTALAWLEQNDATAINGSLGVTSSATWSEAPDTCALTAAVRAAASVAWTEQADSGGLSASVAATAAASWAESSDATSLSVNVGSAVSINAAWTEASDSASVTVAIRASASVGWQEASDSAAMQAVVGMATTVGADLREQDDGASLLATVSVSSSAGWAEVSDLAGFSAAVLARAGLAWAEQSDVAIIAVAVQPEAVIFARAPSGSGYAPQRIESQARPAQVGGSRPPATQDNSR